MQREVQMTAISLDFRFTPADGSIARDIKVTIEAQETERTPFKLTIDWGDGHPDHLDWPGPPLSGLELAARFVSLRILGRVLAWGGGTVEPPIDETVPYAQADDESNA
jgi:hypothetical protein